MKKIFIASFLFLSMAGFAQNWTTNFEEAKATAEKENKKILLVFSGSDWCAPCIKLDKNVWQSEVFKAYANDHLVLLRADFPKKKNNALPEDLRTANLALAEKYNKEGFFPLVAVLDKTGKVMAKKGYESQSADQFVTELKAIIK
ncbi:MULTISPECIES: thioredoxin family protein [unclassified Flavobacterium]|uniref:thioredoxin family protein n=1 Tax=unclassified Flavobacterium TaxID=196869 RepID=UPI000EAC419F|nr:MULTISPECIES: thioredoxin family protein [unclassified Flavobacterium]RKS02596.1 thioredoxin-like protein [Flavobacterium sp. 102]